MANVCQCDACGAIAPYKSCKRVRIATFDSNDRENATKYVRDICPVCFAKLSDVLNLGGNKNND